MEEKNKIIAPICVILAGCSWGSVGVFVRFFDALDYSPLTIVFVRMIIAFVITLIGITIYNKDLLKIKIKDLWSFIGAGISSSIVLNLFFSISTVINSLSLSAILLATAPIFVVFMAAPLFKEKITAVKLQALVIAFIGCVLTSGLIGSGTVFSAKGIIIGVCAGVGYALYSIFSRVILNKGYNPLTINVYSFGIGALACLPFTNFAVVQNSISKAPLFMILMFLVHTIFTSLLPYLLYTYGLNFMDIGKAAILVSVEPVAATFFGVFLYSEIPDVLSIIGIILVLFALVLLNLPNGLRTLFPRKGA